MTQGEYTRLKAQVAVLTEVAQDYPGKTIENVIENIKARCKEAEKSLLPG